jgi:acyl dehydratase
MDLRERFLEDFIPGHCVTFGARTVTAEEIVAFAREYDPQAFHLSEEGGRATPYGGLIASGWHTAALTMRMLADHAVSRHGLGSPGLDELRWIKPVRPRDTLSVRVTVLEARRSRSKPDRGLVRQRVETLNQNGEVVMLWTGTVLVRCREASQGRSRTAGISRVREAARITWPEWFPLACGNRSSRTRRRFAPASQPRRALRRRRTRGG